MTLYNIYITDKNKKKLKKIYTTKELWVALGLREYLEYRGNYTEMEIEEKEENTGRMEE